MKTSTRPDTTKQMTNLCHASCWLKAALTWPSWRNDVHASQRASELPDTLVLLKYWCHKDFYNRLMYVQHSFPDLWPAIRNASSALVPKYLFQYVSGCNLGSQAVNGDSHYMNKCTTRTVSKQSMIGNALSLDSCKSTEWVSNHAARNVVALISHGFRHCRKSLGGTSGQIGIDQSRNTKTADKRCPASLGRYRLSRHIGSLAMTQAWTIVGRQCKRCLSIIAIRRRRHPALWRARCWTRSKTTQVPAVGLLAALLEGPPLSIRKSHVSSMKSNRVPDPTSPNCKLYTEGEWFHIEFWRSDSLFRGHREQSDEHDMSNWYYPSISPRHPKSGS